MIDTRERVYDNFFMGLFGLISLALANTGHIGIAGPIYFLISIPKTLVPWIMGVKRTRVESAMLAASSPKSPRPGAPEESPAH